MSTYFLSLAVLSAGGLIVSAIAGIAGASWHLMVALLTAIAVVALHTLVILFMLISGRLLREGHQNCGLPLEFLERSNRFFREHGGLNLALFGASSIVAAAVLGYTEHAFSIPVEVHLGVGLLAAVLTLVAIPIELRALRNVEGLLDEARLVLDREDAERASRGEPPVDDDYEPPRDSPRAVAAFVLIVPALIYLYRALIVWRGEFSEVSIHPWVEISAVGLFLLIRASRGRPSPA